MKTLKTLWASISINGRDILSTLFWITAIISITQIITSVGNSLNFDLHDLKNFVFAIGKFAAVALLGCGYITHLTFSQSLGEFDRTEFMSTWSNALTPKERLDYFMKIIFIGLVAAAIVFSIGV